MQRIFTFSVLLALAATMVIAADPPLMDGVSGAPVSWSDWLPRKGPVAVLVWASWAPDAEEVMDDYDQLAAACTDAGLHLIILDVQESLEDARTALGPRGVTWIHDRHGALLKTYRVIEVPSILVLSADNETLGKTGPTSEAVYEWRNP